MPMRSLTLMALVLAPSTASSQVFARLSAGATGSSDLTSDVIVTPISQRQSIAPTGQLLVGWELESGYRLALEVRYVRGDLVVHDGGTTDKLGRLATLQLGAMIDGPLSLLSGGALRWEAAVGMLRYRPEHQTGVFSEGNPSRLILGGGLSWTWPIARRLELVAAARYDFHSFMTRRMVSDGFTGSQYVHRIGLTLGLERSF